MSVQYIIEDHATINTGSARKFDESLLHAWIEAQAARTPHHTAIEISGKPLSYIELNARANQVANYLIGKGIGAGDFVAFYQERSADLFIGLLGAMKAGAAYVPVDASVEADRAEAIIAAWEPKLILASRRLAETLSGDHADRLVVVEDEKAAFRSLPTQNRFVGMPEIAADAAAHVVFKTDGEGVEVVHSEAAKFIRSMVSVYGIEASHRCFQDASVALDVALEEVWAMLSEGATVVLADEEAVATAGFFSDEQITFLSTVPEALATIDGDTPTLEVIVVGGRRCPAHLAVGWSLKTRRLVSLKASEDRVPSFSIDSGADAWRPRMLYARAAERTAA